MKRYIKSSRIHPFDETTTDISYYDDFLYDEQTEYLAQKKNRKGEIMLMSPNEYYQECADNVFDCPVEHLIETRATSVDDHNNHLVDKYADAMKQGHEFPLPIINYPEKSQEGLHRMYAAGEAFGWDKKFPVLVVTAFDKDREAKDLIDFQARYVMKNELPYVVEYVCEELANPNTDVPIDICSKIKQKVEEAARYEETIEQPIEVEVKLSDETEDYLVLVYLTKFGDYEIDELSNPAEVYVEDMYKTHDLDTFGLDMYNDY